MQMIPSQATNFQAIEQLAPLYLEHGEEILLASLYFLMNRERIASLSASNAAFIQSRMDDIEQLDNKWVGQEY
jgi:hypothetical protein